MLLLPSSPPSLAILGLHHSLLHLPSPLPSHSSKRSSSSMLYPCSHTSVDVPIIRFSNQNTQKANDSLSQPVLLRPFLPLLTKVHGKTKPLLGRCYRKPLAAAIKFHRAWEASGLFPDKLRKFEGEIENLQREVENHEEVLVDLQGYGSGIGRWGSVGGGRSKETSKASQMDDGPSRTPRWTIGGRRRKDPKVHDGEEEAAGSEDSSSSSRRSGDEEEEEEEEDNNDDEVEEGGKEEVGQIRGRNASGQDTANMSRPRLSMPRHRDAVAPPRSALKRPQNAEAPSPATRSIVPLLPASESPTITKKQKPRYRFRKGIKAYMNDLFKYKVDKLVDEKVERRLAHERSQEPGRAAASGLSNKSIKFSEEVEKVLIDVPEPMSPSVYKTTDKRSVAKAAQPERPRASMVRESTPFRARTRAPTPAPYRVGSTGRRNRSPPPRSPPPKHDDDDLVEGDGDAEERGGAEDEWVDDQEEEWVDYEEVEEKIIYQTQNAWNAGTYIDEDADEADEGARDATSVVANHGSSDPDADADEGVYQDIRDMARRRESEVEPDAVATAKGSARHGRGRRGNF